MAHYTAWTYLRADGLWDWRLKAVMGGKIVSTSGGQGFTEKNDAQEALEQIIEVLSSEGKLAVKWEEG